MIKIKWIFTNYYLLYFNHLNKNHRQKLYFEIKLTHNFSWKSKNKFTHAANTARSKNVLKHSFPDTLNFRWFIKTLIRIVTLFNNKPSDCLLLRSFYTLFLSVIVNRDWSSHHSLVWYQSIYMYINIYVCVLRLSSDRVKFLLLNHLRSSTQNKNARSSQ